MEKSAIERFMQQRETANEVVMKYAGQSTKRFFNLDGAVYRQGVLPVKHKELMGLVASLVLRCDDCIMYHLARCLEEGVTDAELEETLSVGLIVGGSITIPHIRRALEAWEEHAQKHPETQP